MTWEGFENGHFAIAAGLSSGLYYDGFQEARRMSSKNSITQPLMWPEHGVALEAQAFQLDILEDEGEVLRRRVLLLGGPRAETPALFEWRVTSLTIERILRECHRRHI